MSTASTAIAIMLATGPAGEAGGSASASTSTETEPEVDTSVRYSERGKEVDRDKWIYRWAPTRHMIELGVYGGVWFPNKSLELFAPDPSLPNDGWQRLRVVNPAFGLRAGYYPLRFFGVEAEGGVMPSRTRTTDAAATSWTLRGHVVGQLGLWSITPFLLVGAGMVGISSADAPQALGTEQDVAIHFGGGVKAYINRWVQLRLDIRDVVSNRRGVAEGLASSPEILLGLSVTLGRKSKRRKSKPGPQDRDGDQVLDRDDYCPDVFGEPPRGCPQVCVDDNDADGLANPVDKCPNDPESRNGFEDADGCPDEVPPELAEIAGIMEGINFDTDKDTIKPNSQSRLDRAVEVMQKYKTLRVRIVGHTDNQGGYRHNMDLSRRRAESVKRYMVDKGVDTNRLETEGRGPDQPIDTNDTTDGRAKNRRIEFQLLEEDGAKSEVKSEP